MSSVASGGGERLDCDWETVAVCACCFVAAFLPEAPQATTGWNLSDDDDDDDDKTSSNASRANGNAAGLDKLLRRHKSTCSV